MKMLNCNNEILIKQFKNLINKFFIMKALNAISTGITLLAFMMSSCTADEQISVNTQEDAITFSVNSDLQTRAAYTYSASNLPASFHVWADYNVVTGEGDEAVTSHKLYIDGDKVNKTGETTSTKYTSEKTRFWSVNIDKLNFYAYVDDNGSFKYNNGSPIFDGFEVKENVAEQTDLMYACERDVERSKVTTGGAKVGYTSTIPINMHHPLCQVCFSATNRTSTVKITFQKMELRGLCDKGTFNFPTPENPEVTLSNWDKSTEGEHINKRYLLDDINVSLEPNEKKSLTSPLKEDGSMDWSKVLTLIPQNQNQAPTPIWNPQTLIMDEPGNGFYIKIWLKIENIAGDDVTPLTNKQIIYLCMPIGNNPKTGKDYPLAMKPGKRYNLNLIYDDSVIPVVDNEIS